MTTPSAEIRIGLAGLGSRGLYWLDLLKSIPGFRVVALCDAVAVTHESGLAKLGGAEIGRAHV